MARELSKKLLNELKNGKLKTLLDVVKERKDLVLMIRDNYINIYYKGGSMLKVKQLSYHFDKYYYFPSSKDKFEQVYDCKSYLSDLEKYQKKEEQLHLDIEKARRDEKILKDKAKGMLALLPNEPREFVEKAAKVMDSWNAANPDKTKERQEQHDQIVKNINNDDDYCIIDMEYAISSKYPYHCKTIETKSGKTKKPKFDIIAINRNGEVCVIELKKGLAALGGKSSLGQHKSDYEDSIGYNSESKEAFIKNIEIQNLQMKELGLPYREIKNKKEPKFMFAYKYTGEYSVFDFETKKNKNLGKINQVKEKEYFCKKAKNQEVEGYECIFVEEGSNELLDKNKIII